MYLNFFNRNRYFRFVCFFYPSYGNLKRLFYNFLQVREGDTIMIPIWAIHRDPNLFPRPNEFDPERFSETNKANINPMSYMPFGIGSRSCLGEVVRNIFPNLCFCFFLMKSHFLLLTNRRS